MSKKTIVAAVVAVVMILMSVMSVAALSTGVPEAAAEDTIQRAAPTSYYDYDHTVAHLEYDDDDSIYVRASTSAYKVQIYPGGGNEILNDLSSHTCMYIWLDFNGGGWLLPICEDCETTGCHAGSSFVEENVTAYINNGIVFEAYSHGSNDAHDDCNCVHP